MRTILKKSSLKLVLLINASNLEFGVNQKKRLGKEAKCVIFFFFFKCIMCNLNYRFLLSSIFPSLTWAPILQVFLYERVYNFDFYENIFWYRNDQKFKKKNKDNLNHMKEQIQDAIILWPRPSLMTLTSLFLILH